MKRKENWGKQMELCLFNTLTFVLIVYLSQIACYLDQLSGDSYPPLHYVWFGLIPFAVSLLYQISCYRNMTREEKEAKSDHPKR